MNGDEKEQETKYVALSSVVTRVSKTQNYKQTNQRADRAVRIRRCDERI